MKEQLDSACIKLFEYARTKVTAKDIVDFCPGDPGYPAYVREFTSIWESGQLPEMHFNVSETIGLTWWVRAFERLDEVRFRRFRTFTNSVGLAINSTKYDFSTCVPPNYLVASLLTDAFALNDLSLLPLLETAFVEFRERIKIQDNAPEEVPFLTLALTILALKGYPPKADISEMCSRVIKEADANKNEYPDEFLWDCSSFDGFRSEWTKLVEDSLPQHSKEEPVALLREMLTGK